MRNPGRLRERVTLLNQRRAASNEYGDHVDPLYEEDATLRADVNEGNAGAIFRGGRMEGNSRATFTIRDRPDIDLNVNSRLRWRGRDYSVENFNRVTLRRRYIEIEAIQYDET